MDKSISGPCKITNGGDYYVHADDYAIIANFV